jgi:hypothetical protein
LPCPAPLRFFCRELAGFYRFYESVKQVLAVCDLTRRGELRPRQTKHTFARCR